MNESKLLLSQFAKEEGFELSQYLNHLFDFVSHQLGQNPPAATEAENV